MSKKEMCAIWTTLTSSLRSRYEKFESLEHSKEIQLVPKTYAFHNFVDYAHSDQYLKKAGQKIKFKQIFRIWKSATTATDRTRPEPGELKEGRSADWFSLISS